MANAYCQPFQVPISFRLSLVEQQTVLRNGAAPSELAAGKFPTNLVGSQLTKSKPSRILRDLAGAARLLPDGKRHDSCSSMSGQLIFDNLVMKTLLSSAERDRFFCCVRKNEAKQKMANRCGAEPSATEQNQTFGFSIDFSR
jgi:hypothetical protein